MKFKVKYQEIWSKNNIIDYEEEIEAKSQEDAEDCITFGSECNHIKFIETLLMEEKKENE